MVAKATQLSLRSDWKTPRAAYKVLDAEFGFDHDPCPPKPKFDGLATDWGAVNFCNPPYSSKGGLLYKWIAKGYAEHRKGKTVVFLIPARTDTKAWHEFIFGKASEIRWIYGRLHFDDGNGRATFPSAIVVFRAKATSDVTKPT